MTNPANSEEGPLLVHKMANPIKRVFSHGSFDKVFENFWSSIKQGTRIFSVTWMFG